MVVGGLAVAYWGYPRQSLDIDVAADINPKNLDAFLTAARKHRLLLDENEIRTIVSIGNRFVMEISDFRIDCWIPRSLHERLWLKNRKSKKLFDSKINLIAPEDLIAAKLLAGRARDMEDIKTILLKQEKKLKLPYLKNQASSLNVSNILNKLLEENNHAHLKT
jgi:hypothetical protein